MKKNEVALCSSYQIIAVGVKRRNIKCAPVNTLLTAIILDLLLRLLLEVAFIFCRVAEKIKETYVNGLFHKLFI